MYVCVCYLNENRMLVTKMC